MLINLAGRSVNCRYGAKNRREIIDSRVKSTRVLGEAVKGSARPPAVWLQASTATIYPHVRPEKPFDPEAHNKLVAAMESGLELRKVYQPPRWNFSTEVAKAWEAAFDGLILPNTRKVKLRSAMVMSPDAGGVFDTLLTLVKRRLGGRAGDGKQYVSWVHERDFVRALQWIMEREEFRGTVNICAPNPLSNEEFMRELRAAAGVGWGLAAKEWMLEVGAFFMRTETELILKSRRVVPGWLLRSGFEFEFPEWGAAARELCGRALRN